MSSLDNNNPSTTFFPTEAHPSHDYNSLTLRKSHLPNHHDDSKTLPYSTTFPKPRHPSLSTHKQRLISPQLQSIISKIQTFVQDIDSKIQNRVQLVKQVYITQYKQQVLEMSAQLKHLREKLDNQVMKQRANQKMFYLEEERDFFRHQVIKLNQQMNKLNQENKQMKKLLEQQKTQAQNLRQIVYNLQARILKLKNVNIQRNMLLTNQSLGADENSLRKSLNHKSSTVDTTINNKYHSGAKTQRTNNNHNNQPMKSLQTIQDESQRQMSRTDYRLKPSKSLNTYPKLSTSNRNTMRSTTNITYPKPTVQKLQKIQGYSQLLQRQYIVDECINQLKRQIYYRNLAIGQKQTKLHFGQGNNVKFEAFTKTDKKQLIIKLLSSEKILHQFYQYLFNPTTINQATSTSRVRNSDNDLQQTNQLINNKLDLNSSGNKWSLKKLKFTDPKFNTQLLNGLKTQFSKKIFDIKHSNNSGR